VAALEDNTVIAQGPVYKSHEIRKQRIIVSFDNLEGGLLAKEVRMNKNKGLAPGSDPEAVVAPADQLVGFTICGPDRVFYEAKAVINPKGDAVIVGSPKVTEPVAVRYAWATFALANLYNQAGLPAHPFRTDDFSMPKLEATKKNK
jgi:sialate O-acetylesterase